MKMLSKVQLLSVNGGRSDFDWSFSNTIKEGVLAAEREKRYLNPPYIPQSPCSNRIGYSVNPYSATVYI